MRQFQRTNDYLLINDNDAGKQSVKIKFIKTKTQLEQKHNTIIVLNSKLEKSYLYKTETISYDVNFLLKNKIISTIFYCDENYINSNTELINEYLEKYGSKIKYVYLYKTEKITYTGSNLHYLESIVDKLGIARLDRDIGMLGIILSLYLNYNRVCYCFDIDINIGLLKKAKKQYLIENKISIINCTGKDNQYLKKTKIQSVIKPIVLIQQFFEHKDKQRQAELVQCLKNNVANPFIDEIILLNEKEYNIEGLVPNPKITQVIVSKRLSYHFVLNYIKNNISNSLCVISNTDIYFDNSIRLVRSINLVDQFLALLRYNMNTNAVPTLHHDGRPDSQDVWIIDSNITIDIGDEFRFQFGKPGCDNAITFLMMKNRYVVSNPSLSIKCYHLHQSEKRDYDAKDLVITPYYLFTYPTEIKLLKERFETITDFGLCPDTSVKIKYEERIEETFLRKNPKSYFDISKLLATRNKNSSDKIPWDDKNLFARAQKPYIATVSNVSVGTSGIIYSKTNNGNIRYNINPIYKSIVIGNTSSVNVKYFDTLATVVQPWGYGFYHFICEQLPKILYLYKNLISNCDTYINRFGITKPKILTYYNNTFIKGLLDACGIPEECIEIYKNDICYNVKELYVPKPIYCGNPSKEDIQLIRDFLGIKDTMKNTDNTNKPIGIIIKRAQNTVRSIVNYNQLSQLIVSKDQSRRWFEFSSKTITEAIKLFSRADIIIAPHGAGLSNMIFCPRGTNIIEYVSEDEPNLCYWHLSELLGHKYHCIPVSYSGLQKVINAPFDKTIDTLYRINGNKLPTVHRPFRRNDRFDHCGDTFREMIDLWAERGFIKCIPSEDINPWFNGIGNVLLYDRPTYDWFIPSLMKYKMGLFGNPNPPQDLNNNQPWIFWCRRPRLMAKYDNDADIRKYEQRSILSAFMGKIENKTQMRNRTKYNWEKCMEIFEMPTEGGEYKYSQEEYLQVLQKTKFGLCLAGFGGKCNREIELMGLGVVPIFTPGVNRSYYNKIKKNVHYLYARNPNEVRNVIKQCGRKRWEEISSACRLWYKENCSVEGSFKTTVEIIRKRLPEALNDCEINTTPTSTSTLQISRFGTDYGGFYLPSNINEYLNPTSVIYLFGVGEDITFDTYLSGKLNCPVYMFDPTPRSIEHVKLVKNVLQSKNIPEYNKRYGGGDKNYWKKILSHKAHANNLHMNNYGVYTEDTEIKFYKPENTEYVSHSLLEGMVSNDFINVQVKSIKTIMTELNHTNIDLIKLDVEGVECDIINQMFDNDIYPKFICIEFDIVRNKKINGTVIANKCLKRITGSKYTLLHRNNLDMSFMRITE